MGTLSAPVLFSYVWLVVFGGSAIRSGFSVTLILIAECPLEKVTFSRLERASSGLCCKDHIGWFLELKNLTNEVELRNLMTEKIPVNNITNLKWMFQVRKSA